MAWTDGLMEMRGGEDWRLEDLPQGIWGSQEEALGGSLIPQVGTQVEGAATKGRGEPLKHTGSGTLYSGFYATS